MILALVAVLVFTTITVADTITTVKFKADGISFERTIKETTPLKNAAHRHHKHHKCHKHHKHHGNSMNWGHQWGPGSMSQWGRPPMDRPHMEKGNWGPGMQHKGPPTGYPELMHPGNRMGPPTGPWGKDHKGPPMKDHPKGRPMDRPVDNRLMMA